MGFVLKVGKNGRPKFGGSTAYGLDHNVTLDGLPARSRTWN